MALGLGLAAAGPSAASEIVIRGSAVAEDGDALADARVTLWALRSEHQRAVRHGHLHDGRLCQLSAL